MENKRPYWQVGIRLLFSLAATAAFVIIGIKAIGFLMPFVIGWIISAVAAPLVNWLEKRLRIVKKLGFGVDRYPRSRRNRRYTLSWHQPAHSGSRQLSQRFSVDICTTGKRVESGSEILFREYSIGFPRLCRTDGTQLRRILINIWEKLYRESVNRLYLPQEILQKEFRIILFRLS